MHPMVEGNKNTQNNTQVQEKYFQRTSSPEAETLGFLFKHNLSPNKTSEFTSVSPFA